MAKNCAKCGRKIGVLSEAPYELRDNCVLCNECASPISGKIGKLYNLKSKEEFDSLSKQIINECAALYDKHIVDAIEEKIFGIYQKCIAPIVAQQTCDQKNDEARMATINNRSIIENLAAEQMYTTGYDFSGYKIRQYMGLVSGEVVLGTGFFSEFSAQLSDLLGEEDGAFASKLEKAKEAAIRRLGRHSAERSGNAVIGVAFDYITFSNNIIGVVANGTSVKVERME